MHSPNQAILVQSLIRLPPSPAPGVIEPAARHRRLRSLHANVLCALIVSMATPVHAAEPASTSTSTASRPEPASASEEHEARRRVFEQGLRAMREQRWQQAAQLFSRLWQDRPSYDIALNLGLAEYNLGQFRDAAEHLAYGLQNLPPREKTDTATRAEQVLELCEQKVGTVELTISNEGTEVLVNGQPVPASLRARGLYVSPGTHRFEVRLAGFEPESWTASLGAGERRSRSVTLLPEPSPLASTSVLDGPTTPPLEPPPNPANNRPWYRGWTPVVLGGAVTVLGAGAGVIFQTLRSARSDDAAELRDRVGEDGCAVRTGSSADCEKLRDANRDYDAYGRYELGSFIVAGLGLVGTTAYFFVVSPDQGPSTHSSAGLSVRLGARQSARDTMMLLEGTF
jgi:hypothetical protein